MARSLTHGIKRLSRKLIIRTSPSAGNRTFPSCSPPSRETTSGGGLELFAVQVLSLSAISGTTAPMWIAAWPGGRNIFYQKSLKEVLNSPFFKDIRARQPFSDNPLTPCMIIDSPQELRDLVSRHRAYPTHPGAETLLEEMAPELDRYAEEYHAIAEGSWGKEYEPEGFQRHGKKISIRAG